MGGCCFFERCVCVCYVLLFNFPFSCLGVGGWKWAGMCSYYGFDIICVTFFTKNSKSEDSV